MMLNRQFSTATTPTPSLNAEMDNEGIRVLAYPELMLNLTGMNIPKFARRSTDCEEISTVLNPSEVRQKIFS